MQISFAFELTSGEFARLGVITSNQIGFDVFLALPGLKIGQLGERGRRSHPFDRLVVGDEPHVL